MPLVDPIKYLDALKQAYHGGDPLALLQAIRYAQEGSEALPAWVLEPTFEILSDIMTKPLLGTKGKGNAPYGWLKKKFIRAIRASAFYGVRAWQKNPHYYIDMPRGAILLWYQEDYLWQEWKRSSDAARLAATGLHSTEYRANAATLRKAAYGMPLPVRFGRHAVEEELGLRGATGAFGPPPGEPPNHVKRLLSKHPKVC